MTSKIVSRSAPSRQKLAVLGRSQPQKVTGKLKVAIDFMVWQGGRTDYAAAAAHAGLTAHAIRCALAKPHVKRYYEEGLEVLRTSQRAQNIHALARVRDEGTNQMATVQAVKTLEQLRDDADLKGVGAPRVPGVVIQIVTAPVPSPPPQAISISAVDADPLARASDGDE